MVVKTIYETDSSQVSCSAVNELLGIIRKNDHENFLIGLCGGRSILGVLGELKKRFPELREQERSRIHFFLVDERVVPPNDPQSNFGLLYSSFFKYLLDADLISEDQLHSVPLAEDIEIPQSVQLYQGDLEQFGSKFDAVVLGVGEDGHIAGLFPRHESLQENEELFLALNDSPKPPSTRITASAALLRRSSNVFLMFFSEAKRAAYEAFLDIEVPELDCPAKIVGKAENLFILTDLST